MGWITLRSGLHRLLPSLALQAKNKVADTLRLLPDGARICDIGAGGRKITPDTFTVDGFVTANTDLVCDIHHIPLPDESFDAIFSTGTLEHVEDPRQALAEMWRLLKTGGVIHIEVPFIQGFHADPHDYWRWTTEGLRLFSTRQGFEEIEAGSHMGPSCALNWIFNEYLICLFGNGVVGNLMAASARVVMAPFRYLDKVLITRDYSLRIPSGVYFVGRKRS
jgi:SAM-dependent methyltransferase